MVLQESEMKVRKCRRQPTWRGRFLWRLIAKKSASGHLKLYIICEMSSCRKEWRNPHAGAEDLSPPILKNEVLGAVSVDAPACSSGFFAPNKLPPPKIPLPAGGFEVGVVPNRPPVLDAPAAGAVEDGGLAKTFTSSA